MYVVLNRGREQKSIVATISSSEANYTRTRFSFFLCAQQTPGCQKLKKFAQTNIHNIKHFCIRGVEFFFFSSYPKLSAQFSCV